MRIALGLRRLCGLAALALVSAGPAAAQGRQAPTSEPAPGHGRPEWVAARPFGESDVYVLPKGVSAFVVGLRPTRPMSGATSTESAYRADFGLPARFQLGVHATGRAEGRDEAIGNIDAQALEMRWAFAEWGRVWGNPTVEIGWTEASRGPDVATVKLLLGGGQANGWRWGSNVILSRQAGGEREVERAVTAGAAYAPARLVSIGAEARFALTDRLVAGGGSRTVPSHEILAGPSLQFRPVRRLFIDLAPLYGATSDSSRSRTTLLAGWIF
jgi:hypothetical protein